MGRLARAPHPALAELLYGPHLESDRVHVLPRLLAIDAAHLVMLAHRELIPVPVAARLLACNRDMARRHARGEDVLGSSPGHRGLYMLYEGELVRRLGAETGGAGHVARSRNDINSTATRMRLRDRLLDLLAEALDLIGSTLEAGDRHTETLMSAFTHLQPAQPSSLGHYLTGVGAEMLRAAADLADAYDRANRCPMGAAAGFGTSFAIDRGEVADLLGFEGPVRHSLDAVASRDYVVRALAVGSLMGTTLTRLALDLQTWGSAAFGFLDWPDDLVSTSSIMPQKRNAYVFENVRGQANAPMGALAATLSGLKNTTFSNSVEVSGEATAHLWPALAALSKALRLTLVMVSEMEVRPGRMRTFLDRAGTTMSALADRLVARHGLAFRTAHEAVGHLVRELPEGEEPAPGELVRRLERAVEEAGGGRLRLDVSDVSAALDPEQCLGAARYGGGPAPGAVEEVLAEQRLEVGRLEEWVSERRRRLAAAADRLEEAAQVVVASVPAEEAASHVSGTDPGEVP